MKKKFTPGPWKVSEGWDKEGNGTYFPSVVIKEGNKQGHYNLVKVIVNESHDQKIPSIMANAYLISSAPELLEALEAVRDYDSRMNARNTPMIGNGIMSKVHSAIKKAYGR